MPSGPPIAMSTPKAQIRNPNRGLDACLNALRTIRHETRGTFNTRGIRFVANLHRVGLPTWWLRSCTHRRRLISAFSVRLGLQLVVARLKLAHATNNQIVAGSCIHFHNSKSVKRCSPHLVEVTDFSLDRWTGVKTWVPRAKKSVPRAQYANHFLHPFDPSS